MSTTNKRLKTKKPKIKTRKHQSILHCRNDPTWRRKTTEDIDCAHVLGYHPLQPLDYYFTNDNPHLETEIQDIAAKQGAHSDDMTNVREEWRRTIQECITTKSQSRTDDPPSNKIWTADSTGSTDTRHNLRKSMDGQVKTASASASASAMIREPQVGNFYPSRDTPLLATVHFALTETETQTLLDLKACVVEHHTKQFKHRSFGEGIDEETSDEEGGNDVTYLNGFIQIFTPGIAAQMYRIGHLVWEAAGWGNIVSKGKDKDKERKNGKVHGEVTENSNNATINQQGYPDPYKCGIKTAEHLSYSNYRKIGLHVDDGLYTILVSLTDPSDYEGGEYYIVPSTWKDDGAEGRISIKPPKYSAVVFLGHEHHGVQAIKLGKREMFATELWKYPDLPLGRKNPNMDEYEDFLKTGKWDAADDDDDEDADEEGEAGQSRSTDDEEDEL